MTAEDARGVFLELVRDHPDIGEDPRRFAGLLADRYRGAVAARGRGARSGRAGGGARSAPERSGAVCRARGPARGPARGRARLRRGPRSVGRGLVGNRARSYDGDCHGRGPRRLRAAGGRGRASTAGSSDPRRSWSPTRSRGSTRSGPRSRASSTGRPGSR